MGSPSTGRLSCKDCYLSCLSQPGPLATRTRYISNPTLRYRGLPLREEVYVPVRSARVERTAPACRHFERGVVNSSSMIYSQEELQI